MSSTDMPQPPSGHIDIGGASVARTELAQVLPDIQRFEDNLTDALAVDSHLKQANGEIPNYVRNWSEERLSDVIVTLKELGSIREQILRNASSASNQGESL